MMGAERELQQQFLQLLAITEDMQKRIITLEKSNHILVKSHKQLVKWMDQTLEEEAHYRENVVFELLDSSQKKEVEGFWYPNIASVEDTLQYILEKKASIGRFGDGEFSAIQKRIRHTFQTVEDEVLAKRLKEVLHTTDEGFMVAIADNYGNLDKYTRQARREIRYYMTRQVRRGHLKLLEPGRLYYNTYITRPYVMYEDNQTEAPKMRFKDLKKIWDQRDCVFVEGNMTRLGIGNDLFQNVNSVKRILAPAKNAFLQYDKILKSCLKQPKTSLFLLALGPTATILAFDLFKAGYQAIDIGHLDLEYEWFLQGKGQRTIIPGKYNNEVVGGEHPIEVTDELYQNQIFEDCSKETISIYM